MTTLADLREKAVRAEGTPEEGNWKEAGWHSWSEALLYGLVACDQENREYIAAVEPTIILALLDTIDELRKTLVEIESRTDVNSDECPSIAKWALFNFKEQWEL